MKNKHRSIVRLVSAQLMSPLARIVFVIAIIPIHPYNDKCLLILAAAELLSVFLVFGRSYLLHGGFRPVVFRPFLDQIAIVVTVLTAAAFFMDDKQVVLASSITCVAVSIAIANLSISHCLKNDLIWFVPLVNILLYTLIVFSPFMERYGFGFFAILIWFFFEKKLLFGNNSESVRNRYLPVVATMVAFVTQRIDLQIAASLDNPEILFDTFEVSSLFLPLALASRVIANTALIRGERIMPNNAYYFVVLLGVGAIYSCVIYTAGLFLKNVLILEYFHLISLVPIFSCLTAPYREVISVHSSNGNFLPVFILSLLGLIFPLAFFTLFSSMASLYIFILFVYVLPRILMYGYCVIGLRQ